MFLRFALALGTVVVLFALALLALGLLLGQDVARVRSGAALAIICGIPLAFMLAVILFGAVMFRRYGTPLAGVMAAADSVAEGDFSARVPEAPGQIGGLVRSFNRMTERLAQAEQQRRNLTADVAHELRTPLTVIQGNLEGMLDGTYAAGPEQIAAILAEARLMGRLVNDLQTLSLAEAGQLELHRVNVDAGDLLADTVTNFAAAAADAGVELRAETSGPGEGLQIVGDADRLEQVLANLVANALRYTPPGGWIVLRASSAADATGSRVRLEVEDNGRGIPAEDLPHVFDRFWKGDRSRTRAGHAGSGLGLAIARQLIHAHGGEIRARSEPGAGTTFVIELPLDRGDTAPVAGEQT